MSVADLAANAERPEAERPHPIVPLLPDIQSAGVPWVGSARSEVDFWKRRALAAEDNVRAIRAEIAQWMRERKGAP